MKNNGDQETSTKEILLYSVIPSSLLVIIIIILIVWIVKVRKSQGQIAELLNVYHYAFILKLALAFGDAA